MTAAAIRLNGAGATEAAGAELARALLACSPAAAAVCVFLRGELGAGKTTFARGLLRQLGHTGRVPSPTYTLVEPYTLEGLHIWHLDLYRLGDPGELDYLGLDDMLSPNSVLLVEWPERGTGYLPVNDLEITLKVDSSFRLLAISAGSEAGRRVLAAWRQSI